MPTTVSIIISLSRRVDELEANQEKLMELVERLVELEASKYPKMEATKGGTT